ncbi:hypothetical protein CPC08DRAFT_816188 [Agrocybe pediades]|nr:hypothetical protein CPC08DRAFT_816188 [Agrocybe pediades]
MSSPKSPIAEGFVAIGIDTIEENHEDGADFDNSLEKQAQPATDAVPASEILPQASERQELLVEELDSVLPILKLFNGLVSINDTYYIQGGASQDELLKAASIAKNITKYTVTDHPKDRDNPKIHTGAFLRLVQLLNPVTHSTILFPNLTHLRIDRAAASADQLTLFCAPSLNRLELIDISDDRQDVLRVFLRILADTSKGLESITLQGPVQYSSLKNILLFDQLCHLHINAATTIKTGFLKVLGSRSPSLEALRIDMSKAKYVRYPSRTSASESVTTTVAQTRFHRLSKLYITGGTELIEDMLGMVSSKDLDELSLVYQWPTPSTLAMPKKLPGMSLLESEKIKKRLGPMETLTWASAQDSFFSALNSALLNWKDTLRVVDVGIYLDDWTSLGIQVGTPGGRSVSPPLIIPEATFSRLMDIELRELRVSEWKVDSDYDIIQHLLDAQRNKLLEVLELPAVRQDQEGIPLVQLSTIAQNFPKLHSLICPLDFDVLDDDDDDPLPFPAKALSHQLRSLGIWYTEAPDDEHLPILARYIDYLFPEIDSIFSMGYDSEEEEENWRVLGNLVKLCQSVRKDDVSRRISEVAL